jgi:hypothetical protein
MMVTDGPYPLFLNAVALEDLPDDELELFATNLAIATRHAINCCEPCSQIEAWVRHWARAESERQKRGMEPETLMERVH